jgi:hypothetical protein
MNLKMALVYCLSISFLLSLGQIKTVNYNVITNQLNADLALPAEENFKITGVAPTDMDWVEVRIYKKKVGKQPDNIYHWRRPFGQPIREFDVHVDEPLRSNDPYIFQFLFYKKAEAIQIKMLQQSIHKNLSAYIDANFEIDRKGLKAMNSKQVLRNNLAQIVQNGMEQFKHFNEAEFQGFSDITNLKIDQIQNAKLKNARFNIFQNKKSKRENQALYAKKLIDELKELLYSEVDQFLSADMLVLTERRETHVRTEKITSYLPINLGYGGVYFGGNTNNFEYGGSPYLGVSFPLGNRAFTKFLGNASLSTGVLLRNVENNNRIYSGPLVERPIYLALGYQVFRVMRFNAGAVLTSTQVDGVNAQAQSLQFYPFVGISLELNLWVGFNRKR